MASSLQRRSWWLFAAGGGIALALGLAEISGYLDPSGPNSGDPSRPADGTLNPAPGSGLLQDGQATGQDFIQALRTARLSDSGESLRSLFARAKNDSRAAASLLALLESEAEPVETRLLAGIALIHSGSEKGREMLSQLLMQETSEHLVRLSLGRVAMMTSSSCALELLETIAGNASSALTRRLAMVGLKGFPAQQAMAIECRLLENERSADNVRVLLEGIEDHYLRAPEPDVLCALYQALVRPIHLEIDEELAQKYAAFEDAGVEEFVRAPIRHGWEIKRMAADLLFRASDPGGTKLLADWMVKTPDEESLAAVLEGWASIEPSEETRRLGPVLERVGATHWSPVIRVEALRAAARHAQDSASVDSLLVNRAVGDPEAAVRLPVIWMLANVSTTDEVRAALLGSLASDPDPRVRAACAESVIRHAPSDHGIEEFVARITQSALVDANADVRAAAVEALGRIENPRAMATLLQLVDSEPVAVVRAAAVGAIAIVNAEEAAPLIDRALKSDPSPDVRSAAVRALANHMPERAMEPLIFVSRRDADEQVRKAAIEALAGMDRQEAWTVIIERLRQDPASSVRISAAEALRFSGIEDPAEIAPLGTALEDEKNLDVRIALIKAVEDLDARQLLPTLRRLSGSADGILRQKLDGAIKVLGALP